MRSIGWFAVTSLALLLAACGNENELAGGSGLIETDESLISAETSGRVLELRFKEGDSLSVGDTLVVIDPSTLELNLAAGRAGRNALAAQLESARIQVNQTRTAEAYAKTEFNRAERLLKSGTTTQQRHDQAKFDYDKAVIARRAAEANVQALKAQLDKADADIAEIERMLEDCYPTAPIPGIVTEKYTDIGELLAPGKAIARISRLDTVWVKVYLPAGKFAHVKLGDSASVSTESGGTRQPGTVIWTSSEAEFTPKNVQTEQSRADLVYAVKVSIPNTTGLLKIGMPVYVTLEQ